MAYKAEVIADGSGQWCGNGLVFQTERAARLYVMDLAARWTAVRETRVVECQEEPKLTSDTVRQFEAIAAAEQFVA